MHNLLLITLYIPQPEVPVIHRVYSTNNQIHTSIPFQLTNMFQISVRNSGFIFFS